MSALPEFSNKRCKPVPFGVQPRCAVKPDFRERLLKFGAEYLTDEQLLAVLLRTGTPEKPVGQLAQDVMKVLDISDFEQLRKNLACLEGLGSVKLCTVMAAIELGRRFFSVHDSKINHPSNIVPYLMHYAGRKQETFLCASLSGANEIIAIRVVSVGTVNRTLVHPREVFADPIQDRAASIIVAHNHPSGNLQPSGEDIALTRRLADAGDLLGISLLDHIILSARGEYYSFMEEGRLPVK